MFSAIKKRNKTCQTKEHQKKNPTAEYCGMEIGEQSLKK